MNIESLFEIDGKEEKLNIIISQGEAYHLLANMITGRGSAIEEFKDKITKYLSKKGHLDYR